MRKFSDEERARIHEELIQTGRELLVKFGPTKTTVKDITDPVGIAKPTFYQFFDAKSDLYVKILNRELDEFTEQLRAELEGIDDPRDRLEQLFSCYVEFGEENEFIQQVFIQQDYREVFGDISSDQLAEIEQKEAKALFPPIKAIQSDCDGPISEMEPITVLGLMGGSLGMMVLHKEEYEEFSAGLDIYHEGIYDHLQEAMISTLARGLTVVE